MRTIKRWLAALCVLLAAVPALAESYTVTTAGTLSTLVGDKKSTITELTLSGQLNGTDFIFIRQMAALTKLDMLNVEIVAGGDAYYGEYKTTGHNIPECLLNRVWIGDEFVAPLQSIVLPKGITTIGKYAFAGMYTLNSVTLPEGLLSIEEGAFSSTDLTSIVLPSTLETFGHYVLGGCSRITTIHIPKALKNFGILDSHNVQEFTVDEENAYFTTYDGSLYSKDLSTLYVVSHKERESLVIPEGVTRIAICAAREYKMTSVTLPQSLVTLEEQAFAYTGLTSVHFPANVAELGLRVFTSCPITSLTVDAANTNLVAQDNVLFTKDMRELLLYPMGLTAESYAIPEGVTTLCWGAFEWVNSLKQLTLPYSLRKIDRWAVNGLEALESVTIPPLCTEIGTQAFYNCKGLKRVTIPGNVTSLGGSVFQACASITEVHCNSKTPYNIDNTFFELDYANCKLNVPTGTSEAYRAAENWSNFTNIEEEAVADVSNGEADILMETAGTLATLLGESVAGLTKLTVSGPINGDDVQCFLNIPTLEVLDLRKANIVAGGSYAARNIGLDLPTKKDTITKCMFHGDLESSVLREVYVPESATTVEYAAFALNPQLEIIHLGNVSSFVGGSILDTRSKLKAVYCLSDVFPTYTDDFNFYENPQANATLYVQYGLKDDYEASEQWAGFKEVRELACVKTPGTLSTLLGDNAATDTLLCVAGNLNGTDIKLIRNMTNLRTLDMRLANIVAGGDAYYVNEDGTYPQYTEDNVIGTWMFFSIMTAPLETVYLPNTTVKVADGAFTDNSKIRQVFLNEGLQQIEGSAFNNCVSLQSVAIPASVTDMDFSAFGYWSHQTEVEVAAENPNYASLDGALYSKDMSTIIFYPSKKTGSLTLSVKKVSDFAFTDTHLSSVSFKSGLTEMGQFAFYESDISSITLPNTLTRIDVGTFAACFNLQQVTIPESVTQADDIFSYYGPYITVNSIVWNSSASLKKALPYPIHPNTLLYVKAGTEVDDKWQNVIVDGVAEEIVLKDTTMHNGAQQYIPFFAAKPFKAKKISYVRTFNRTEDGTVYESGRGTAGGWQTITLPFTPTRIYHEEQGDLAPFNNDSIMGKPFWLRSLGTEGFVSETSIQPNTPYIIAMPNHATYDAQYNVVGDVWFTAESEEGIAVAATPDVMPAGEGTQFSLHGTYDEIYTEEYGESATPGAYCLNTTVVTLDGTEHPIGSIFSRTIGMAHAFSAYVTSKETTAATRGPLYYSIGGGSGEVTGLEDIVKREDTSLKVYTQGNVLCIVTDRARALSLYDATGRTIRHLQLQEGLNEVTGLAPGFYFMEGRKVLIP